MNMQEALDKLAAGTSATNKPVKTAPAGQPKTAPVPGNSGNSSSPPSNPTVAPGPVAHSNATSASGKPQLDTAPEGGAKGQAQQGTAAQTKAAGFALGLLKAAREAAESAEEDGLQESLAGIVADLEEQGVDPEVFFDALALQEAGIEVKLPTEMAEKVAKVIDVDLTKVALSDEVVSRAFGKRMGQSWLKGGGKPGLLRSSIPGRHALKGMGGQMDYLGTKQGLRYMRRLQTDKPSKMLKNTTRSSIETMKTIAKGGK